MSQSNHQESGPGRAPSEKDRASQGLTRLGRIGGRAPFEWAPFELDRGPWQVACQQSLLPFFPAAQFDIEIQPLSSPWDIGEMP